MSENNLRIILLGKGFLDTNIVGNLILGRSAFDPPHSVGLQCEAVRGYVNGRYITIINAPYLFGCTLTYHQLTLRIKKCVSLAAPGPHVIMLVVQPESLTEKDITRVDKILSTLSEESHKYTMVLTTKNMESVAQDKKDIVQKIIAKANSNHLDFSTCSQTDLVEKMEEMVRENKGSLICEIYEDAMPAIWQQIAYQRLRQETGTMRAERIMLEAEFRNYKERAQYIKKHYSESKQIPHLKVVQLETGRVKDSSSKKTLESSSVCVEQKEVRGHLITHLMMPALHSPQLSEQEVMHQIFHFVSASDSGVHAFFINVPEGPPADETKAEIKMFQRIFGSRVNDHTIFIIQQQSSNTELDKDLQSMINACGGRYTLGKSKISLQTLFPSVEKLLKENNNRQYTMAMFVEAQLEEHLKYKHELITLQRQMTELKRSRSQTHDLPNNHEALRIVLLGKIGVGKSTTGNTIMGKQVFKEMLSAQSVSTVCQKEWVEIRGRKITVIDTPGLFDTKTDNEAIRKEIVKCISMAAPGPHVFLLVLRLDRFTEEERNAVKIIENTFGKTSNQYTIILFTRGDDLYSQTIEEFLQTSGTALNTLLFSCGNRYHVFNNRDNSSNTQVLKLLDKIDTMVNVNGGSCYTNEMFQEVEEKLEKEKERILKEREEQIERERKELETKHEAEMEKMRREMQKQKERQEAERREKEEQREKQIKREMAEMEEKLREDCRKRKEDDLKMAMWMEVINREREENRKQWEKQREEDQKRRDQEEQERRREDIWKSQQMEEKQKFEREKEEIRKSKEKELEKLQMEYELRASEEDKRMKDLEEKIKNAEESKKKELQDLMLSQQREKEQRMKSEEEKRKQQEKNWEEKSAAMEERWRSEQLGKTEEYERKLQKENEERDLKEKERKQKEEEERQRIETDYTDKIKMIEEQLKEQREKYEKERMKKDEEHKKELEDKMQKQSEFKKEKEENERKHNDEMEKHRAFFQKQHEKALQKLKEETEQEARKQAEKEFYAMLDKKN